MQIRLLSTDGSEQAAIVNKDLIWAWLRDRLAAANLEFVNLRDGRILIVDQDGWASQLVERDPLPGYDTTHELVPTIARKPVNPAATALYRTIAPDRYREHSIVGDAAVVLDKDFVD